MTTDQPQPALTPIDPAFVEQLRRAIRDEGPQPAFHRETMARHRKEWPTLWDAIDKLLLP